MADPLRQVVLRPAAEQTLRNLASGTRLRIMKALHALGSDPLPRGAGKLVGALRPMRLRIGDYRVIYQVKDKAVEVLVIAVGPRRDVYQQRS